MKKPFRAAAALAAVALITGCVAPTPFQPRTEARGAHGFSSVKVEDGLLRVEFHGNARTTQRAVDAYVLYRAAELANEAAAPAFAVLEGDIDRAILEGEDRFALSDGSGGPDTVVGGAPLVTIKTAGLGGFRAPAPRHTPLPAPKTYAPTYIYTPYSPAALPQRSLLVRLLNAAPQEPEAKTFLTEEVLRKLGPRITRPTRNVAETPRVARAARRFLDQCEAKAGTSKEALSICQVFSVGPLIGARWADSVTSNEASRQWTRSDMERALATRLQEEHQRCMQKEMRRAQLQGPPKPDAIHPSACSLPLQLFIIGAKAVFDEAAGGSAKPSE